jgi:hypothetical protein
MKAIAAYIGQSLQWTQPQALKKKFELRAADEILATLELRSMFGSLGRGESADGCWTFKRVGFFQTRVTIRSCESETEIAQFKNSTWKGGGTLELPDGRELRATTNFWQTKLDFLDPSEAPLISFHSGGVLHLSAEVNLQPNASTLPELPWITMLGFYLIIMMQRDAAGAAAAAAAAG